MYVYSAVFNSIAFSAAGEVMEIQVQANARVTVLRAWLGAAEGTDPVHEIQEVALYVNDAGATGGVGLLEQRLDSHISVGNTVTGRSGTIGATPLDVYFDAFSTKVGWLYHPTPGERITMVGGQVFDNCGIRFPVAPDVALTLSGGMTYMEHS